MGRAAVASPKGRCGTPPSRRDLAHGEAEAGDFARDIQPRPIQMHVRWSSSHRHTLCFEGAPEGPPMRITILLGCLLATGCSAGASDSETTTQASTSASSRPAVRPRIGATISSSLWPKGTSMAEAITSFDGYMSADGVNRPMAARVEKAYRQEGDHPSTIPAREQGIIDSGAKLIVSWEPSRTKTQAEYNALKNDIELMQRAYRAKFPNDDPNTHFESVLWQEASGGAHFSSGQEYLNYVEYYAGAITSLGQRLVVDFAGSKPQNWKSYFPAQAMAILVDYYGSAWKGGVRLDGLQELANQHSPPLSVGLGEWNQVANSDTPLTLAEWNAYTTYLIDFFRPLALEGRMGDMMIWMGDNPAVQTVPDVLNQLGGNCDTATPPYNPIVNMRRLYDALSTTLIVLPNLDAGR